MDKEFYRVVMLVLLLVLRYLRDIKQSTNRASNTEHDLVVGEINKYLNKLE